MVYREGDKEEDGMTGHRSNNYDQSDRSDAAARMAESYLDADSHSDCIVVVVQ